MTTSTHPERSAMEQVALRLNERPKARNLMEAFRKRIAFRYADPNADFDVNFEGGSMTLALPENGARDVEVEVVRTTMMVRVIEGTIDISHPIARGDIVVRHGHVSDLILFSRILALGQRRS